MTPTEKHRETAEKCVNDFRMIGDGCEGDLMEIIVTALDASFREGMKRAAEIARQAGDTWSGSRDHTQAAQEAAVDAKCEEIASAILSEAGKG